MTWLDRVFVAVVCAALGAFAMSAYLELDSGAPCPVRCRPCSDDRWAP